MVKRQSRGCGMNTAPCVGANVFEHCMYTVSNPRSSHRQFSPLPARLKHKPADAVFTCAALRAVSKRQHAHSGPGMPRCPKKQRRFRTLTPTSSSIEPACWRFTAPSSAARRTSPTRQLAKRRAALPGTRSSGTATSLIWWVYFLVFIGCIYPAPGHTVDLYRATHATCSRSARRSGTRWRGTLGCEVSPAKASV